MQRHLLIAEFLSTPWALMPERIHAAAGVLHRWAAGKSPDANVLERIAADREARDNRREANGRAVTGSIAVLPLYGVLTQRGNMMDDISGPGSTSTQLFAQAFREAVADDTVGAILIDIDSPGGSVYGTSELAAEILQARNSKPVCAIANSLAASAAYWIGSAASELYVTPSGEVGMAYEFSFYVSLSGSGGRNIPCNKIGMLFSTVSYDTNHPTPIANYAQFYSDSIISDTLNWVKIITAKRK